jgi:hypothetical protein
VKGRESSEKAGGGEEREGGKELKEPGEDEQKGKAADLGRQEPPR